MRHSRRQQIPDELTQQRKDRVRDANAVLAGFGHVRFDYPMVQYKLNWCIEVILARLQSGKP